MTEKNETSGLRISVWHVPESENTQQFHPWEVQHQPEHSEIEVYVEATGQWEIVAEISGEDHIAIAETIVALANAKNRASANYVTKGGRCVRH